MSPLRPVVYTAITAGYDQLKEPPHAAANGADFVAFVDEPCESRTWRSYPIHHGFADPTRNAKIHKILSHRYLPTAEYTLWLDGSVIIAGAQPLQRLIDTCLAECDIAVFSHRHRTCLYQEASVCLERRLDAPEVIWQQICRYTADGFPPNAGLAECCVILRRQTPAVRAFNEAWWEEIANGSRRDQLSFDYVAHKHGLRYATFPGTIADNPWFRRVPHARPRPPLSDGSQRASSPLSPAAVVAANAGVAPQVGAGPPDSGPAHYFSSPRHRRRRKTIAFGRVRDVPSWHWAGFEVGRELSKHYEVVLYEHMAGPPPCDVLFLIKQRPSPAFVSAVQAQGTALVYCPIDAYQTARDIEGDAALLRACSMLLVHSERLLPLLRPYCGATHFVEHYTRYALHEMAPYKADGFILWVGHVQYVPYLVRWLEEHPIDREVRILTDLDSERGWARAHTNAAQLGLSIDLSRTPTELAGCATVQWSERRQQDMMRACKAAFDVKHTELFSQHHKPPTKAQQFVASGIPCAVNPDAYSAEYFRVRGFDPASPADAARWLSPEYWEATHRAGAWLRRETSIEAVAARYRDLIEAI